MPTLPKGIRHDVVTDELRILETAPLQRRAPEQSEQMTLEELTVWIGQPDLKTPMSQNLAGAVDRWFLS